MTRTELLIYFSLPCISYADCAAYSALIRAYGETTLLLKKISNPIYSWHFKEYERVFNVLFEHLNQSEYDEIKKSGIERKTPKKKPIKFDPSEDQKKIIKKFSLK